jgi:hypothetical protein
MVNVDPIFVIQGNFAPGRIAAANTASDGSGALVTIVTSAADGTRVDGVRFRNSAATATTSGAMQHRIFLSNTAGTNFRLIGEVATPAGATRATATNIGATSIYTFDQPIIMKSGQIMSVCQSVYAGAGDQTDACAFAGDYNL